MTTVLPHEGQTREAAFTSARGFVLADRIIVILAIVDQLALSAFGLLKAWTALYFASSDRFSTIYMLAGIVSAFILFLRNITPRIAAALWHAIFIGLILSGNWKITLASPSTDLIRYWAMANILVVGYMAVTSARMLFDRNFLPAESITAGKATLLIDAMIIAGIALGQLVFSVFVLVVQFTFAYMGGFDPVITPYMVIGLISGIVLFSGWVKSRIVAIVWQVVLVGVILIRGNPASPSDMAWKARALWFVPAIVYLSVTAAVQLRKRKLNTLK